MSDRVVCPASGKRCACTEGSIRWLQCRNVALDTVRRINESGWVSGAQAGQARALEARARGEPAMSAQSEGSTLKLHMFGYPARLVLKTPTGDLDVTEAVELITTADMRQDHSARDGFWVNTQRLLAAIGRHNAHDPDGDAARGARAALEEIARLPCQYPDDPDAEAKMALDCVRAQEIAAKALEGQR